MLGNHCLREQSTWQSTSLCSAGGFGQTEACSHTASVDPGAIRTRKGRNPTGWDSRQRGGRAHQAVGGTFGAEAFGFHWFRVQEYLVETTPGLKAVASVIFHEEEKLNCLIGTHLLSRGQQHWNCICANCGLKVILALSTIGRVQRLQPLVGGCLESSSREPRRSAINCLSSAVFYRCFSSLSFVVVIVVVVVDVVVVVVRHVAASSEGIRVMIERWTALCVHAVADCPPRTPYPKTTKPMLNTNNKGDYFQSQPSQLQEKVIKEFSPWKEGAPYILHQQVQKWHGGLAAACKATYGVDISHVLVMAFTPVAVLALILLVRVQQPVRFVARI
eukprot:4892931-Amphidinium_carterae.1